MKIIKKSPDPFYYQGNKKIGLLLIHGFTGSASEMKLLGDFLHEKGYSVYAPLLKGHGLTPEEMSKTNKDDWWNSVIEGYDLLKEKDHDQIIAIGLSMGGILSLKLALERKLIGVIPLAAPIFVHDKRMGLSRWIKYVKAYQTKQKKNDEIEEYLVSYDRTPIACVESLHHLIREVKKNLANIHIPIQIMQGKKDETVVSKSAVYIFNHVGSMNKALKWYEHSSHIMTLDREREKIFLDILDFIEKLNNS